MKKVLLFALSILISANAFAFGGGSEGPAYQRGGVMGVNSLGIYLNGNKQVSIKFSCDDPNATPNLKGVCECKAGYGMKDGICVNLCAGVQAPTCQECYVQNNEVKFRPVTKRMTCDDSYGNLDFICQSGTCTDPCTIGEHATFEPTVCFPAHHAENGQCVPDYASDTTICPDGNGNDNYICQSGTCTDPCTVNRYHEDDPYTICKLWCANAGYCRSDENNADTTVCPDGNGDDNYICQSGTCTDPCDLITNKNPCKDYTPQGGQCVESNKADTTVCPDGNGNDNYICQSGTCTDPCTIGEHATFEPTVCFPAHHAENGQCVPDYAEKGTKNCDSAYSQYVCDGQGVCTCPEGYFKTPGLSCESCTDSFYEFKVNSAEECTDTCGETRKIFNYNNQMYCQIASCPEGTYRTVKGTCRDCDLTSSSEVSTSEDCIQACAGTTTPRTIFMYNNKQYCSLVSCDDSRPGYLRGGETGMCYNCSYASSLQTSEDECHSCLGKSDYPRFIGNYATVDDWWCWPCNVVAKVKVKTVEECTNYCGDVRTAVIEDNQIFCVRKACDPGTFLDTSLGTCVQCTHSYSRTSSAKYCDMCKENPRFMGSDNNCYICTTSDSVATTEEACNKCPNRTWTETTPASGDTPAQGTCALCPEGVCPEAPVPESCSVDNLSACDTAEKCTALGDGYTYSAENGCQPPECTTNNDCTDGKTCDTSIGKCVSNDELCPTGSFQGINSCIPCNDIEHTDEVANSSDCTDACPYSQRSIWTLTYHDACPNWIDDSCEDSERSDVTLNICVPTECPNTYVRNEWFGCISCSVDDEFYTTPEECNKCTGRYLDGQTYLCKKGTCSGTVTDGICCPEGYRYEDGDCFLNECTTATPQYCDANACTELGQGWSYNTSENKCVKSCISDSECWSLPRATCYQGRCISTIQPSCDDGYVLIADGTCWQVPNSSAFDCRSNADCEGGNKPKFCNFGYNGDDNDILYPQWSQCETIGAYKIDTKYTFSTPETHFRGKQFVNRWSVDNVCKLLGGHVTSTKDMGITTINYSTSVDYIQNIEEFKKEAHGYNFWLRDISPDDEYYNPYMFRLHYNEYNAETAINFTSGNSFICADTKISSCLSGMIEHNGVCTYPCPAGYLINDDDHGQCSLCDTANGYVSDGLGKCVQSSSLQSCSSYADCSNGQFCVFQENTQMATTNCSGKPTTGTCRNAPSNYSVTINNTTYTHAINPYNYWSMQDFCQSKGKTMVTSSELLNIYSTWNQMHDNGTAMDALVNNWTQDAFVRTDNDDDDTGIADSISGNVVTSADGAMIYCLTNIATTVCK